MSQIIIQIIITGTIFLLGISVLIFGFIKNKRELRRLSLIIFFGCFIMAVWTSYTVITKSYKKFIDTLKPRTGDEIYDGLFGKREHDCVKVLNKQDQVIPKIDYAIWLEFTTCPEELNRILSKYNFTSEKLVTMESQNEIPDGEILDWFRPATLGDTLIVYEYVSSDNRNVQTIWVNTDSSRVFVRDILD